MLKYYKITKCVNLNKFEIKTNKKINIDKFDKEIYNFI